MHREIRHPNDAGDGIGSLRRYKDASISWNPQQHISDAFWYIATILDLSLWCRSRATEAPITSSAHDLSSHKTQVFCALRVMKDYSLLLSKYRPEFQGNHTSTSQPLNASIHAFSVADQRLSHTMLLHPSSPSPPPEKKPGPKQSTLPSTGSTTNRESHISTHTVTIAISEDSSSCSGSA